MAECHRVLKPGGRLVICAWLACEDPRGWERRYLLEPICREGRLPGLGSEGEYRRWLADGGFQLDRFDDLSRKVSRTWEWCMWRFVAGLIYKRAYWRVLRSAGRGNRIFAMTLPRIWLAYGIGAMRYGIFTARK